MKIYLKIQTKDNYDNKDYVYPEQKILGVFTEESMNKDKEAVFDDAKSYWCSKITKAIEDLETAIRIFNKPWELALKQDIRFLKKYQDNKEEIVQAYLISQGISYEEFTLIS